jgi:hypothetical protein
MGARWQRVLRVVAALPDGDSADQELARILAVGDFSAVLPVLEAAGLDEGGVCLGALDLVTLATAEARGEGLERPAVRWSNRG